MVEQQQQQIRQLQAQVAAGQQPIATPPQVGQIPAQPTGYDAAAGAPAAGAAAAPATGLPPGATIVTNDKTPLNVYWNNGLWYESANKEFAVHLGGRMEWDAGTYEAPQSSILALRALNNSPTSPGNANGLQNFQDNMDFRRARLRADGTIYENIDFICEFEFAGAFAVVRPNKTGPGGTLNTGVANSTIANAANLIDAVTPTWVECTVKDIPLLGNVMAGQFLVPFSFDLATSDEYTQFIERSAAFDVFVPQSGTGNFAQGVEFFDWNEAETMTWRNALTTNTENDPFNGIALANDAFSWIGRVTWLPYYDEASGGRYLVHVGLDGQVQGLERDVINFHDRGDVHEPYAITPSYVNQNVVGTYSEMICPEFVTVLGTLVSRIRVLRDGSQRLEYQRDRQGELRSFLRWRIRSGDLLPHRRKHDLRPPCRRVHPRHSVRKLLQPSRRTDALRSGRLAGRRPLLVGRSQRPRSARRFSQ